MTSTEKVSIVIPAYNAEKTIAETLESVRRQSYSCWEIIAVDNHSADRTGDLLEKYRRDPDFKGRLRVLHCRENIKAGGARNLGVREASGKWIAFLDSDDCWAPEKLEKQMKLVQENPDAELLYTGSAFIDENGTLYGYELEVPGRLGRKDILKQNLISCSSVLVKRDWLLKYPMPRKPMMHEDFAVWLQILSEVPYAYGVQEPLLLYRVSGTSQSGNKLKAAKMNWNTLKYAGISPAERVANMAVYAYRGIRKYAALRKSKR